MCVGVGIFVLSRRSDTAPVRYRSTVSVRIAEKPKKATKNKSSKQTTTTTVQSVALSGQQVFAMLPRTRAAALQGAGLPTNSPQIGFVASVSSEGDILSLSATAPTRAEAAKVARSWSDAYVEARRLAAKQAVQREKIALSNRRNSLDAQLKEVNRILTNVMPVIYREILRNNAPFGRQAGSGKFGGQILPDSAVPSNAPTAVVNLTYQRAALLVAIDDISKKIGLLNIANASPEVFAVPVAQTPPTRVTSVPSTAIPAALALLAGLILALGAAVALDRLDGRIRTPEQAAQAFRAPVLSVIPGDDEDFAVLDDPLSAASQAYRGLAATSIATDHLPKAIMVSTPHGDAHDEVAANFAAALSRLGLRVALLATDPGQAWFSDAFATPSLGASSFTELLERAHDGTLNGELQNRLPTTDLAPNLVLVPPAAEEAIELPLDGLPPLLEALSDAGIDIAVVAGPALLEHPDATIVAWATRSVLWALFSGEVTADEARAAAARLQLAGVTPFGVVMVGSRRTVSV